MEVASLIGSFIRGVEADSNEHQASDDERRRLIAPEWALMAAEQAKVEEDRMAAIFWNSLGDAPTGRSRLQCIPEEPAMWKGGCVSRSRVDRLSSNLGRSSRLD